jgi:hypothetical protein
MRRVDMETLEIIYSKYEPWDKLLTFEGDWYGYVIDGSEVMHLRPNQALRLVSEDASWDYIGKFLHGWWMEHYIANLDGHVNVMWEAGELRSDVVDYWLSWLRNVDPSTLADEMEWLLRDEINDVLPYTHELAIVDGWYTVTPKGDSGRNV